MRIDTEPLTSSVQREKQVLAGAGNLPEGDKLDPGADQDQSGTNDMRDGLVTASAALDSGRLEFGDLFGRQLHQLVFGLQPIVFFVTGLTAAFQVDLIGAGPDLIFGGAMDGHGSITLDWLDLFAWA